MMADLHVSQAVIDGVAQSLTTAAGPLQLNDRLEGGVEEVLASAAVATALRGSANIQTVRASTASTSLTALGSTASDSAVQMLTIDADLARMAG